MVVDITTHYRLGLEELAAALSSAKSPEAGAGLLSISYGEMKPEEVQTRLTAASHSLMARRLLTLEPLKLDENLVAYLELIVEQDFVLRMGTGSGADERILNCYVKGDKYLLHEVERGVVHELWMADSHAEVQQQALRFFQVPEGQPFLPGAAEIPNAGLEKAREAASLQPGKVTAILKELNLPADWVEALAEDLRHPGYRGSVMRIEIIKEKPTAERGFLVLKGKQRTWLFFIFKRDGQDYVRAMAGSPESFQQRIEELFGDDSAAG